MASEVPRLPPGTTGPPPAAAGDQSSGAGEFADVEDVVTRFAEVGYLADRPARDDGLPAVPARQAGAPGGACRRRQDPARRDARRGHRTAAAAAAVLRGPGRDEGPLRVGLRQAAALHPAPARQDLRGRRGHRRRSREAVARIGEQDSAFFSETFLAARPLLEAVRSPEPVVLLVDEIDRADEALEAVLLELLAEFQVSVPELGTFRAVHQPYVILTSNTTRDLSAALKRRCLHLFLDYPSPERELEIVRSKDTGLPDALARRLVDVVRGAARPRPAQGAEHLRDRRLGAHPRRPRGRGAARRRCCRTPRTSSSSTSATCSGRWTRCRRSATRTPSCRRPSTRTGTATGTGTATRTAPASRTTTTARGPRARPGRRGRRRRRPGGPGREGPARPARRGLLRQPDRGRAGRRPPHGRPRAGRPVVRGGAGPQGLRQATRLGQDAGQGALTWRAPSTGSSGCCGSWACGSRCRRPSTRCASRPRPACSPTGTSCATRSPSRSSRTAATSPRSTASSRRSSGCGRCCRRRPRATGTPTTTSTTAARPRR